MFRVLLVAFVLFAVFGVCCSLVAASCLLVGVCWISFVVWRLFGIIYRLVSVDG